MLTLLQSNDCYGYDQDASKAEVQLEELWLLDLIKDRMIWLKMKFPF